MVVNSAPSAWLVSRSGAAVGCWGLAKSVNADAGQMVQCVELCEIQCPVVSADELVGVSGSCDAELGIGGNGQLTSHRPQQVVALVQHSTRECRRARPSAPLSATCIPGITKEVQEHWPHASGSGTGSRLPGHPNSPVRSCLVSHAMSVAKAACALFVLSSMVSSSLPWFM